MLMTSKIDFYKKKIANKHTQYFMKYKRTKEIYNNSLFRFVSFFNSLRV